MEVIQSPTSGVETLGETPLLDGKIVSRELRGQNGVLCSHFVGVFDTSVEEFVRAHQAGNNNGSHADGSGYAAYAGVNVVEYTGKFHHMIMYLVSYRGRCHH